MKGLRQWLKLGMIIIGILGGLIFPFNFVFPEEKKEEISYTQFLNEIEIGKIKEIKIFSEKKIKGKYIDENTFITSIPYYDEDLIRIAKKNNVILWYGKELPEEERPLWLTLVFAILFTIGIGTILLIFLSIFLERILHKRWGLFKTHALYEKKVPEQLNELIKKLDSLIEILKNKEVIIK